MNIRQVIMNEKTRITLSVVGWLSMIVFVISATAGAAIWKTNMENDVIEIQKDVTTNEESILRLEISNTIEHTEIKKEVADIRPDIVEIKTDLKWIRAFMERE